MTILSWQEAESLKLPQKTGSKYMQRPLSAILGSCFLDLRITIEIQVIYEVCFRREIVCRHRKVYQGKLNMGMPH